VTPGPRFVGLEVEPNLDPPRSEPRFEELLLAVKLRALRKSADGVAQVLQENLYRGTSPRPLPSDKSTEETSAGGI
jgi:hypothetical protein